MSGREYGHPAVWLAPAVLLVLAVFPLPYGYYTFLRICICGASAYLAFREWDNESSVGLWVVVFAVAPCCTTRWCPSISPKESGLSSTWVRRRCWWRISGGLDDKGQ